MQDEHVAASAGDTSDNLEEIEGIGSGYAKALHKIGIHRFSDLAQYVTANQLRQALLTQAGMDVPLRKMEKNDWIGQAQALAARQTTNPYQPLHVEEGEVAATSPVPPDKQIGHRYIGFSVFFEGITDENGEPAWQTRAYHDESGEEVHFTGIEASSWANWILDRAGLRMIAEALPKASDAPLDRVPEASADSEPQAKLVLTVEETRIEIVAVEVSEIGPSISVPKKQIQAQIRFKISGPEAEKLVAQNIPFRLEVYIVDTESGALSMVTSERVDLQCQVFAYTCRQQFPIPEVGRYRLYCIALLLPPGNLVAYYAGPMINVVP